MTKLNKILKYSYLGNVYPLCREGWFDLLYKQLTKIDREIYPKYLPTIIKRLWYWLHYNSPIKYFMQFHWYCYNIFEIKQKYGRLRIYDCATDIYDETCNLSWNICEQCGSTKELHTTSGYMIRLCNSCYTKYINNEL